MTAETPKTAGIRPATGGPLQLLQFADYSNGSIPPTEDELRRACSAVADAPAPANSGGDIICRALAGFLAQIVVHCPAGPERSTAISRAREARMWAEAAIATTNPRASVPTSNPRP